MESLQQLFLSDVGASMDTLFSSFNPNPIGVASLAQVHIATDRESGRTVAVKVMHPDLEDFAAVDMKTTTIMLKVVKTIFPAFEVCLDLREYTEAKLAAVRMARQRDGRVCCCF